jgi:hypothetical protein
MQRFIILIKRSLLMWLLLIAALTSFDAWLVLASAYSGYTGELRVGIPYAYFVKKPLDPWSDGDPHVTNAIKAEELQVNVAAMGVVALVSAIFWPSRSPAKSPSTPSPIGASAPTTDVATRDELHIAALDRRSRRCLRLTIMGSLLGFGWVFGELGWLRGRTLSTTYTQLGRVPPWTATAAWAVGRGIFCAVLVGILGLLFAR